MLGNQISCLPQFFCGLKLPLCRNDLRTSFSLRFRFLGHRPLQIVRQGNVFDLNRGHLRAPRFGMFVDDILDLDIYLARLRKELIELEFTNHIPHGRLADLVDRIIDILDRDYRLLGIDYVVISNK